MYYFGRGKSKWLPYLGMLPGVLLFAIFALGPSLATAVLSLTNITGAPDTPWQFIGFKNYTDFFSPGLVRDNLAILQRTIVFCVVVTLVQNAIALGVAIVLNSRIRGHLAYRSIIFMPVVLGVTVIGLIWGLILDPGGGPAASLLAVFKQNSAFLGSYQQAFGWVMFVQIWSAMGYSMVIFLAGLQAIPAELTEAAIVDGASAWQRFRSITYPLLAPSVTVNLLLAIIGSLQVYQLIYVLTAGQFNTNVLAYQIFAVAFTGGTLRQGYASALSMMQFALIAVVALGTLAYLRRREVQL